MSPHLLDYERAGEPLAGPDNDSAVATILWAGTAVVLQTLFVVRPSWLSHMACVALPAAVVANAAACVIVKDLVRARLNLWGWTALVVTGAATASSAAAMLTLLRALRRPLGL